MARDIEEFLKKAAERRKQNAGNPPKARPNAPPPSPSPPRSSAQSPPVVQPPPRPRLAQRPDSENIDDDAYATKQTPPAAPRPPATQRETVAEHVLRAIVVDDVTEHASHLGEVIELTDEKVETRLEKFDHAIGSLEGKSSIQQANPTETKSQQSAMAKDLLQLFHSPQTVRQSILVSEILKRPNFDD